MKEILLSEHELSKRHLAVQKIVRPLISDRNKLEVRQVGASSDYTLGVLAKGTTPSSVADPNLIRVQTKSAEIFLNYYEVWKRVITGDYSLDRAYLHIHHARRGGQDRQVLCLHCDPRTGGGDVSYSYKRGPHLHVLGGNPTIDRAHIAVCVNDDSCGGKTAAELTTSLIKATEMISREILPQYRF